MRTQLALEKCAEFLCHCLKIGWPKQSLDELEAIWWEFHDDFGNLLPKARRK